MSSDKAIAVGGRTRAIVEGYLKEMGVPTKYADQMYSVPKDEIRWINKAEFEADFNGFIPGLKDWVDARCNKWTDGEKALYEAIKNKTGNQMTQAERIMSDAILKKNEGRDNCEREIQSELSFRAYKDALEKRGGRKLPN